MNHTYSHYCLANLSHQPNNACKENALKVFEMSCFLLATYIYMIPVIVNWSSDIAAELCRKKLRAKVTEMSHFLGLPQLIFLHLWETILFCTAEWQKVALQTCINYLLFIHQSTMSVDCNMSNFNWNCIQICKSCNYMWENHVYILNTMATSHGRLAKVVEFPSSVQILLLIELDKIK